jgi:hypothetical protein
MTAATEVQAIIVLIVSLGKYHLSLFPRTTAAIFSLRTQDYSTAMKRERFPATLNQIKRKK